MKKSLESEFGKRTAKQQEYITRQNAGDRKEVTKTRRFQGGKT